MSITVATQNDVTVIKVEGDTSSPLSLTCQILRTLCYSPLFCSLYRGLMNSNVTAALGTIQIMAGLMNIGLGFGLFPTGSSDTGIYFWLGGTFIMTGTMSIVAGHLPSLSLVCFTVCVNMVGAVLALYGFGKYVQRMELDSSYPLCRQYRGESIDDCLRLTSRYQFLSAVVSVILIVLAVLHFCVCLIFVALGSKAVAVKMMEEREDEDEKPLLKEDQLKSPDA